MSGSMRHRVLVQRKTQAVDALGQPTETYSDTGYVWANIRPLKAEERYATSGELAEITHEIKIRHGITIAAQDRITYGSRTFDVEGVYNEDERDRFLVVRAVEVG